MKTFTSSLILILSFIVGNAQDLESILDKENEQTSVVVSETFKGTRIANGQSVETRKEGILDFLITHRFGTLNSGAYELWGLDEANIRLALEYALTDDLTLALGRSSYEKTYDGYIKYRLFYQKTGVKSFPLSITLFGSAAEKTLKDYDPEDKPSFSDRLAYTSQILIARRISQGFSFQITPTYIHFNQVPTSGDPNDMFALGFGARIKVSKRMAINGEYYYNFNEFKSFETFNSLSVGVEFETGGHVFQLVFTNSRPMIEKGFITETTGDFFDGDVHFGFNISRSFQVKKSKREKTY
jgi:hypothetical protein